MASATVSPSATSRPIIFALLVALATGACAATVAPTEPPTPTPLVIVKTIFPA